MRITHTRNTGMGLLGLGYGLAENTLGLPVVIPNHHSPAWPKLQKRAFVLDSGVSAPSSTSKSLNYNIFITLHYIILY
jgi:hypothetical protein